MSITGSSVKTKRKKSFLCQMISLKFFSANNFLFLEEVMRRLYQCSRIKNFDQ